MISPADRARLVKVLGMLGSSRDGEALNAARAAHRLLLAAGVIWDEVIARTGIPAPQARSEAPRRWAPPPNARTPAGSANPWPHLANDLLKAMVHKRIYAPEFMLLNKLLDPFYQPTQDELAMVRVLYQREFGRPAAGHRAAG